LISFVLHIKRGAMLNQISNTLAEIFKSLVFAITQWANRVLPGMHIKGNYWIILDIFIVAFIIYWFLSKILESKAIRILYGIIILIVLLLLGHFLNLLTLNWLLKYLGLMLVVAIPIIFQPELRSALDKLGRFGFSGRAKFSPTDLQEILLACRHLLKNGAGALIAIERKVPLKEYAKSGQVLHADISKELIASIFNSGSPLHDGALIISGNKIIAAGCMLPIHDHKDNLGARHRAARTLTGDTDAVVVLISEERQTMSLAFEGEIEVDLELDEVKNIIEKIFSFK